MPNFSGKWTLTEQAQGAAAGTWPLRFDYQLYAWGDNASGQLGVNNRTDRNSPVQVGSLSWSQISAGKDHNASILSDGTLWTWGDGNQGRLGHNSEIFRSSPTQVGALTTWSQASASQSDFTAAIKTDGTLWTWGEGLTGRLGQNSIVDRSSPVQVGSLTDWFQVSAGNLHAAAVKTDGTLWIWGQGNDGRLGQNDNFINRSSPVQVGSLATWSRVSAGGSHTLAVKTDGTLWSWGNADEGRLGHNNIIKRSSPVQVGALTNWSDVEATLNHSVALKTDGTLWTWGSGSNGRLGDNAVVNRSSPVQVGALTTWSKIAGGSNFTGAVKTDGTLWTWGDNGQGQLGQSLSTTIDRSSPVQVGSLTNWSQVSMGYQHTIATIKA